MLSIGNYEGLSQLMNQKTLSMQKRIENSLVNMCVLQSIRQTFNEFTF
jgi:hypothetical protein